MIYNIARNLPCAAIASLLAFTAGSAKAVLIGFDAEDGASVTTTATATIGSDFTPAIADGFALGGEYLGRSGNGGLSAPDSSTNLLSYDVTFPEAGEYDLYARVLFEINGSDDSFYYGNGFGVKDLVTSTDWVRVNGLPDAGFPAATYFWINLSENIGQFPTGTATTFTVGAPGVETIQFGGREDGLRFDAFAFGTAADSFTDQQLSESVTNVFNPPNEWNLPGSGDFNVASNWSDNVVPAFDALFGNNITQNATITLDSAPSLNSVTFGNPTNQYTIAGPNALTLVAAAQVSTSGTHTITANVAGTAGLTKLGNGTLNLSGAKSYTGETDVQEGNLVINNIDAIDNQASATLNIAAGATVTLNAGATGTLAAQLTGASTVSQDATLTLNNTLAPTDTVTISRSNAGYGGVIRVNGGTLVVANNEALGDGGEQNDRTNVRQNSLGKIALPGGITIANEVLDFEGRGTDDVALSSSGSNAWNGVIVGEGSGTSYGNIESTSGTLTLDRLYAEDTNELYNYTFSGAGTTSVTGRISDADIDVGTGIVTVKTNDNVGVIKRGTGTLRIDYATTDENDYWFGPTTIEEGTLRVASSGASNSDGELRSSSIAIKSGGTLDVSAYTEYTQQIGQAITGSGSINVGSGNLRLIDVSSVAPGDVPGQVGTLTVTSGTVTLPDLALGGGGVWKFDVGNSTNTTGDLLNVQNGSFSAGTAGITVNVTPAHGHLDAGSRTIVTHTGGANSVLNGVTAQITDANGNALTTRQSVAINGDTAGQVNVVVTGEEASRTWSGASSSEWDVSTSNWTGGDQQFRDLDHVTFNDSATTKNVTLASTRAPGSVTFSNTTPYSFTGTGGIVGSGAVNVNGTGEVTLANTGNNYTGATTIAAGGKLRVASASTGSITNSGTLSFGIPQSIELLIQDGSASVGAGGYKVFAYEAEDFQSETVNNAANSAWTVRSDIAGSSGDGVDGQALYASELASDGTGSGTTSTRNFTTYNMKFTEPGSYMWYFHMVSVDSAGNGLVDDDDSFYTVTGDMTSANLDPTGLAGRIDNFGSGRIAAEGVIAGGTGSAVYDWYRNGDSGSNAAEFHRINVTQADVDSGAVFKFKVATREGGLTLDKFVFVADADYATDPNFGTLVDGDLDGAASVAVTQQAFTAAGTVLNVQGDFTMTSTGTLNMLLSSSNTHDRLIVGGALTADGTLDIAEAGNGFAAEAGDVFDIFSFDSASGAFDSVLLPALSGLYWDATNLLVTGDLLVKALEGDFNTDGVVDAADYTVWRDNLGAAESVLPTGTGDGSGTVDQGDYAVWAANYGTTLPPSSFSAAVPEPTSVLLLATLLSGSLTIRCRRG